MKAFLVFLYCAVIIAGGMLVYPIYKIAGPLAVFLFIIFIYTLSERISGRKSKVWAKIKHFWQEISKDPEPLTEEEEKILRNSYNYPYNYPFGPFDDRLNL